MKVYIGPYVNFFNTYTLTKPLIWFIGEERASDIAHRLSSTWVGNFLRWIDDKRKRKVKVVIHEYDTWSLDSTLSHIIHPCLIQLAQSKHGVPFVDNSDVPKEYRDMTDPDDKYSDEKMNAMQKKWDWVIGEMIWAFGETVNDTSTDKFYWTDENGHYQWDEKALRERDKRIDRGFRLFGKYYRSLWD